MAERRDRNRRLALRADQAGTEVGFYTVVEGQPGAAELERLLSRTGERAAAAVERLVAGPFPPAADDRAWLSVFIALQLLLGRGHRQGAGQAAGLMGELIVSALEQLEAASEASEEEEEEGVDAPPEPAVAVTPLRHDPAAVVREPAHEELRDQPVATRFRAHRQRRGSRRGLTVPGGRRPGPCKRGAGARRREGRRSGRP